MTSGSSIHVVATTIPATRDALATAATLAEAIDARVHVIVALAIPSDGSLDRQSAPVQAFAKEIRQLPEAASPRVRVLPCVCRRITDIAQLLPRQAVVIMGGRSRRWWPTREQRLAHDLEGLGYRVTFVHTVARNEDQP